MFSLRMLHADHLPVAHDKVEVILISQDSCHDDLLIIQDRKYEEIRTETDQIRTRSTTRQSTITTSP